MTLTFAVETPVAGSNPVDAAHIDIQIPYEQGGFFGSVYQAIGETSAGTPDDSHLVVNPTNRLNLTASGLAPFGFIGATPGEDFWLLPQGLRNPESARRLPLPRPRRRRDQRLCHRRVDPVAGERPAGLVDSSEVDPVSTS